MPRSGTKPLDPDPVHEKAHNAPLPQFILNMMKPFHLHYLARCANAVELQAARATKHVIPTAQPCTGRFPNCVSKTQPHIVRSIRTRTSHTRISGTQSAYCKSESMPACVYRVRFGTT
ncbi:hypothetical protein DOTSEDRAFT_46147 [Dothistroma septosporum NZE10]|uniref:Uncharacterized protein n=1 Tax=Dothistroma septosporum (strain NZE10 / CBS 128990) TaxID=675120 RepID=N1PMG4_DOTSN|nr:hypothetical protein DOTSEDRAFT_46147 [Dothistroma septosporum NZE10]